MWRSLLHAVSEGGLLVGVVQRTIDTDGREGVDACVGTREASMSVGRRHSGAMVRVILQNVAVDRMRLDVVQRGIVPHEALVLQRWPVVVHAILGNEGIEVVTRMHAVVRTVVDTNVGSPDRHTRAMVSAAVRVVVLALKLVLDALAIRGVPDQRQDWANALDEKSTLTRLRVVQRGLRKNKNHADMQR